MGYQLAGEASSDRIWRKAHLLGISPGRPAEIEWPFRKCITDHVQHEQIGSFEAGGVAEWPRLEVDDDVSSFLAESLRRRKLYYRRHRICLFHRQLERGPARPLPDLSAINSRATQRIVFVNRAAQQLARVPIGVQQR